MAGKGIKREVVGWYLTIRVVDEKALTRAGMRVVAQMTRVAVGRSAGNHNEISRELRALCIRRYCV